jgi:hypothetical protein
MTVAPSRPYEHSYDPGKDPFELVDTHAGHRMERWRADALLLGETSGLVHVRQQVRNDAVAVFDAIEERERAVTEREAACDARERALAVTATRLRDQVGRATAHWDKIEQACADQERELEAPLPAPPGELPEPSLALEDDTHIPSGELHDLPAKEDPDVEGDVRGEFLRLKDDEVEFPMGEQPSPPAVQQPIVARLDDGD